MSIFFTGNDYYFERKYEHIPNNSNFAKSNYLLERKSISFYIHRFFAFRKLSRMKNKNVVQPEESQKLEFSNKNKTVLIIGQVINDFSILQTKLDNINSLYFYKDIIYKILENTNFNIVFKAHPWENKKANLKAPLTLNELSKTFGKNNRVLLTENFNIYQLFRISNFVLGLSSQGLLEASLFGKKPLQFGNAFYANQGFTYDFKNIEEFLQKIDISENLNITEKEKAEDFFIKILEFHTIPVSYFGRKEVIKRL
ncbi:capsule polysaccharide export protein [Thiovulum sp. ES]|nr:capsule polysaccharide export protein [Thiovulum sp. ES]